MELLIRKACETDMPGILDINNYEILHGTVNYDFIPKSLDEQLEWFHLKVKEGFPILVVLGIEQVLGFATYGAFRPKPGYKFTVEHSVYISPEFRGRGIGNALMYQLIGLAKESGFHTMIGGIDASNTGSYKFHEKLGFREVARFKETAFKFDRWLDLIFMQLMLD